MEMTLLSQQPEQKRMANLFGGASQIELRSQWVEKQLVRVAVGRSNPLELGIHSLWKSLAQRSRVIPKALCNH